MKNLIQDLTILTVGERFWLDRLNRSENQIKTAVRLGIAERRYRHIECGRRERDKGLKVPAVKPSKADLCRLARRRDGRNLRTLGRILGAGSHVSLLEWEREGDARLVGAWQMLGYRFD